MKIQLTIRTKRTEPTKRMIQKTEGSLAFVHFAYNSNEMCSRELVRNMKNFYEPLCVNWSISSCESIVAKVATNHCQVVVS